MPRIMPSTGDLDRLKYDLQSDMDKARDISLAWLRLKPRLEALRDASGRVVGQLAKLRKDAERYARVR